MSSLREARQRARFVSEKQRLVELIRSHADGLDSRIAVEHGERSITYGTLGGLIDERISELVTRGAASGSFVAIERRKSAEFIVDFLSVFAIGGTVIPLDPDIPADRRETFHQLARPEFLLRGSDVVPLAGDPFRQAPDDGAFVFFTSGSTGVPKPVLGSAAALRSFIDWFCPEFGIGAHDRFAFVSGVSFEASLRDIFPPLAAGATLVVPEDDSSASPEEAVAWLARKGITVVTVVPSVARMWLRDGQTTCPAVRAAFFLGEPLTADVVAGWRTTFPGTTVRVNSYGSTESGQGTIYRRVADGEESVERVPAGRPVPGTRYCLMEPAATLDADLVRARLDQCPGSGEIVIVSRACSHGYLGMDEENRARFARLGDGVTAYRTGDLGRVDENGDLVVIGRVDDEVKINGVRVHPAEVMRAIRGHHAVADVFVTATQADPAAASGDARLTAYVVPAGGGGLSTAELRSDLTDLLPLAMIPSRFVEVAELPTTRTGKIDRAALVTLAEDGARANQFVAPSGEIECFLADQFSELLGVERVSAGDDFFALGGDSIAATRLASRIWQELDVNLSPRAIFGAATITGIAAAILEEQLLSADPDELRALLDALDDGAVGEAHQDAA
jgi:acyl-coenzyme A synthetase/AMP-(fatty) acid ligase/acyl carrier protein